MLSRGEGDAAGQLNLDAMRTGTPDNVIVRLKQQQSYPLFNSHNIEEILSHVMSRITMLASDS